MGAQDKADMFLWGWGCLFTLYPSGSSAVNAALFFYNWFNFHQFSSCWYWNSGTSSRNQFESSLLFGLDLGVCYETQQGTCRVLSVFSLPGMEDSPASCWVYPPRILFLVLFFWVWWCDGLWEVWLLTFRPSSLLCLSLVPTCRAPRSGAPLGFLGGHNYLVFSNSFFLSIWRSPLYSKGFMEQGSTVLI